MKPLKTFAAVVAIAVGLMAVAESASARDRHGHHHHGHHHGARFSFGFWGGPGFWGPGYWGPGFGYWGPPAVVYAPAPEPRVWVESDQAVATPPVSSVPSDPNAPQWWYWCGSARGYYPYVSSCTEGWQRVAPQPTPPAR